MSEIQSIQSRLPSPTDLVPADELGGIRLRGILDSDLAFLFQLSTRFSTLYLWDDGANKTIEGQFKDTFLAKSQTRDYRLVERVGPGQHEPIGLSCIYSHDPINEWAYFTLAMHPNVIGKGWGVPATILQIDHAFFNKNLYKLYAEILSINRSALTDRCANSATLEF